MDHQERIDFAHNFQVKETWTKNDDDILDVITENGDDIPQLTKNPLTSLSPQSPSQLQLQLSSNAASASASASAQHQHKIIVNISAAQCVPPAGRK